MGPWHGEDTFSCSIECAGKLAEIQTDDESTLPPPWRAKDLQDVVSVNAGRMAAGEHPMRAMLALALSAWRFGLSDGVTDCKRGKR